MSTGLAIAGYFFAAAFVITAISFELTIISGQIDDLETKLDNQSAVTVDTSKCPKTAAELASLTETNEADWKQADALRWQFVATGSTKLTIPLGGIYSDALTGVYAAGPTGPAHINSSLGGWRCLANVQ